MLTTSDTPALPIISVNWQGESGRLVRTSDNYFSFSYFIFIYYLLYEVVVCPSAFPDFTTVDGLTSRRREKLRNDNDSRRKKDDGMRYNNNNNKKKDDGRPPALDVQETIRDVHKFGAMGFTDKQQKKAHKNDEYEKLTGRTVKRQKIPMKILVGMRKKAMQREEREKRETRESGVVDHHTSGTSSLTNKKKKRDNKNDKKPVTM